MNSLLLQIATKYLKWILLVFAIIALLRGHNNPGGGFIAGLLIALSVVFQSLAGNPQKETGKENRFSEIYIAVGLLFILFSTIPGVFLKNNFMAGVWVSIPIPLLGDLKIGTPFLFDIGVFFAVIGVTLLFFFTLNKISKWK